ncbi:glycosyltransferase [Solibacillus ferritrahens]|uniref:glycosyltransferase n=1 Tax=Solibacillus ferritrahens TaxID=3098620 RepID=UPI00300B10B8
MKSVQILLSTYNGERYLDEQLQSLIGQVDVNVSILVRDDGSKDSTQLILEKWGKKGIIKWYKGENLKPAKSFWDLVKQSPKADYYAFCDQDDIWEKNKLIVAINQIEKVQNNEPTLYYSALNPVDENLNAKNYQKNEKHVDSLGRAMLVSYAAGCTMVFNHKLMELAQKSNPQHLRMHDHWLYLICSSVNGKIIYDTNSYINYRQHSFNTVGISVSKSQQFKRLIGSYNKGNQERWRQVKELKVIYSEYIPEENLQLINSIVNYRNSLMNKFKVIFKPDLKTGFFTKDCLFYISIIMGKF